MELTDFKKAILTRPTDFMYFGDKDLDVWGFTPISRNRDSEILDNSNYETILKDLTSKFPDDINDERFNHWAVGWVETIMVNTINEEAVQACLDWYNKLDDYPVADEEDLSNREYEAASNAYNNWAKWDIGKMAKEANITSLLNDGEFDPTNEQEEIINQIVTDAILDYCPGETSYKDNDVLEALIEKFSE